MSEGDAGLVLRLDVEQEAPVAFDQFVDDLVTGLSRRRIRLIPGATGRVIQDGGEIGRITAWERGRALRLHWTAWSWGDAADADVDVSFTPLPSGTRISITLPGWSQRISVPIPDVVGWFAMQVAAPALAAATPGELADWVTDRRARRPSGASARETYRDPAYHRPNFKLLLRTLALRGDDRLLEVGCGGGAFLQEALASGCRAAALDHSPDMTRLARELNRDAAAAGRLLIVEADAARIPFASNSFSAAVSTGVFGFIADPVPVLSEIHRVLVPGGRLAVYTGTHALAGTPAAPEPMASRIHFYEGSELERAARQAGFEEAEASEPDMEPFAREAGLSEEQVGFFRGSSGSLLLTARKG